MKKLIIFNNIKYIHDEIGFKPNDNDYVSGMPDFQYYQIEMSNIYWLNEIRPRKKESSNKNSL